MHPDERKDTTHTQEAANSRLISPEDLAGYSQVIVKIAEGSASLYAVVPLFLQIHYLFKCARQDSNLRPAD